MEKYRVLLAYVNKQRSMIKKLHHEIVNIDVSKYDSRFRFALQTQQFYTALEDLFKQIARTFENHIEDLTRFHKEILIRMSLEIPQIRPQVLSQVSIRFLDKIRAFRHFIRHAYDCELDELQLASLQALLRSEFPSVEGDLEKFHRYLSSL
jgi:hypothetical protein